MSFKDDSEIENQWSPIAGTLSNAFTYSSPNSRSNTSNHAPSNLSSNIPPNLFSNLHFNSRSHTPSNFITNEYDSQELSVQTIDPSQRHQYLRDFDPLHQGGRIKSSGNIQDDISSIDWMKEEYRASKRIQRQQSQQQDSIFQEPSQNVIEQFKDLFSSVSSCSNSLYNVSQGWILAIIIGLAAGIVTSMARLCSDWIYSLRIGFCKYEPWLNMHQCCQGDHSGCDAWIPWTLLLPGASDLGSTASFIIFLFISLTCAIIASWISKKLSKYNSGSGFPEIKTILNGGLITKCLGLQTMISKSVSMILTVGSGLTLGLEEPIAHVICAYSNVISRVFPKYHNNEAKRREMLGVAFSAAMAAAFRSTLGGILLALEDMCTYFNTEMLLFSLVSCTIATNIGSFLYPTLSILNIFPGWNAVPSPQWIWIELIPFTLVAIVNAFIGVLLKYVNTKVSKLRRRTFLRKIPIIEISMITLLAVLLVYWIPFLRAPLHRGISVLYTNSCGQKHSRPSSICNILEDPTNLLQFLGAPAIIFLLSSISFGSGIPTGILLPSLTIGSCFGMIMGLCMKKLQEKFNESWLFLECEDIHNCIYPNIYALIGGLSTLIGTTGITVSFIVILIESFGFINLIAPLTYCALVARCVFQYLGIKGIYDVHIQMSQYPYLEKNVELQPNIIAADIMTPRSEIVTISAMNFSVKEIRRLLDTTPHNGFPVLLPNSLILGYISRSNLNLALKKGNYSDNILIHFASEQIRRAGGKRERHSYQHQKEYLDLSIYLESTPLTISQYCPINSLYSIFKSLGTKYIFVAKKGCLEGLVTKKDIIHFINKHSISRNYLKNAQFSSFGSLDLSSDEDHF